MITCTWELWIERNSTMQQRLGVRLEGEPMWLQKRRQSGFIITQEMVELPGPLDQADKASLEAWATSIGAELPGAIQSFELRKTRHSEIEGFSRMNTTIEWSWSR